MCPRIYKLKTDYLKNMGKRRDSLVDYSFYIMILVA